MSETSASSLFEKQINSEHTPPSIINTVARHPVSFIAFLCVSHAVPVVSMSSGTIFCLWASAVPRHVCHFFCRSTWESHCSPLSDMWVIWMRSPHVPIKVVFAAVDMPRHRFAAAFYFALVALALAVRSHVPCQVLLCGKCLVTS
jgi:hypothetical protein